MINRTKSALLVSVSAVALILGLSGCKTEANDSQTTEAVKEVEAVQADSAPSSDIARVTGLIKAKLGAARGDLVVGEVAETEVAGLYHVEIVGRGSVYMLGEGDYFFSSDLMKIEGDQIVSVSEREKSKIRGPLMAQLKRDEMIIFSPSGETKASITVFTDVDCGYCQKLHKQMAEMNDLGIEVKYLAFPRAGIPSANYDRMASAWCSDNPQDALTKLKNRESIPPNVCEGNPIEAQYLLGQKVGVTGTPSIVFENGDFIPGYLPTKDLAARLGIL